MLVDIPGIQNLKLPVGQEIKLQQDPNQLKIGQIFKVVVVASVGESRLMLNLDGANINAKTSHQFYPGEELKVKVEKQDGETVLKIQNREFSQQILNQALRTVLPRQAPADQLLNTIKALNQLPEALKNSLPPATQQALSQLTQVIPTRQQLSHPDGLKQAIQNSGTFLESKLATPSTQHSPNIQQDFKTQLLKVLSNLEQITRVQSPEKVDKLPDQMPIAYTSQTTSQAPLSNQEVDVLDHAARLKRAATLIRAHNFSNPLLNLAPRAGKMPLGGSFSQFTSNAASQSATQTQTSNPQSSPQTQHSGLQQTHTSHNHTEVFKHAPMPLKGALPQPIKTPALPVDLNQPNNLAETLKESVTQALARVQANQLSSIPKDPTTQPSFLVDLPVSIDENSAEVIPMLIEEEEAHSDEECEKNSWSITLALDMENLGTLQVKVSLIADKIDVNIWADLEETRQLFEQKNYLLADALQQENLLIRTLAYHLGLQENEIETESFNMLDIKI